MISLAYCVLFSTVPYDNKGDRHNSIVTTVVDICTPCCGVITASLSKAENHLLGLPQTYGRKLQSSQQANQVLAALLIGSRWWEWSKSREDAAGNGEETRNNLHWLGQQWALHPATKWIELWCRTNSKGSRWTSHHSPSGTLPVAAETGVLTQRPF